MANEKYDFQRMVNIALGAALTLMLIGIGGGIYFAATHAITVDHLVTGVSFALGALIAVFRTLTLFEDAKTTHSIEVRKEDSEKAAAQHPEKPQLAWVAGRFLLEKYLDRNLKQVRTIATLTYCVMLAGFAFILFGLIKAFNDPSKLPVAIVASASGVLVSFIGGSFLLVYRSLLTQTKDYIFVLERINSVGMSMAVIGSIPEDAAELRQSATAQLSKDLLTLYGGRSST
jgi:hypothetical protein